MGALFPGANGAIDCGSASDIDNIFNGTGATVMAWIRAAGYGEGGAGRVFDKANGAGNGWVVYVTSSGRITYQRHHTVSSGIWQSDAGTILLNTWYHVVATYDDADDPQLYIDGQAVTTTEASSPSGTPVDDSSRRLFIGDRPLSNRAFDGIIADPRLYKTQFSAAPIQTIFNARGRDCIVNNLLRRFPFSPARPGLGLNTPYVDHTRQSNADSSSIVVNVPAHKDGDTLVMVVSFGGTSSGAAPNITEHVDWTERLHLDLPATATTPVLGIYTRPASSEPASYTVVANNSSPVSAFMVALRGLSTEVPQDMVTSTGTSSSPSSNSATPGANAVVLRVMCMDNEAQIPTEAPSIFPVDVRRRDQIADGNGTENGMVLAFGEESRDGGATGARVWSPDGSDQWAAVTATWLHGDGLEGLPAKDVSNAKDDGETWGAVVGAEDILEAC